jgi:WD repeat-containing protein 35
MINNRNKSVVRDMKWTADGRKICIIYEDGAVIVGSVDGNRLWGKELSLSLRFVEWSPDCKLILFVTMSSDVLVYDSEGVRLRCLPLAVRDIDNDAGNDSSPVVGLHWYAPEGGSKRVSNKESVQPSLCIALANGAIQLSRGDDDPNTVFINTDMVVSNCRWNSSGSILAVTGCQVTLYYIVLCYIMLCQTVILSHFKQ